MDRRNFFKILTVTTAGAAATSCGTHDALIPLLVPEHNIPIGEERWHPAVCTECAAGCGTLVRVMGAERVIDLKGEQVRQRVAAVKKIEGNPLDPISGGRLCARGQAVVQALYHPDRLRGAMRRQGNRGNPSFAPVASVRCHLSRRRKNPHSRPFRIVFLTGPNVGSRSAAIQGFLKAIKAPSAIVCSLADFAIERKASEAALGWKGLPVYDVANATHDASEWVPTSSAAGPRPSTTRASLAISARAASAFAALCSRPSRGSPSPRRRPIAGCRSHPVRSRNSSPRWPES